MTPEQKAIAERLGQAEARLNELLLLAAEKGLEAVVRVWEKTDGAAGAHPVVDVALLPRGGSGDSRTGVTGANAPRSADVL